MKYLVTTVMLLAVACSAFAQECKPPALVYNSNTGNLFNPEQEMILGELTMQRSFSEMRYVNDEKLLAYLKSIGERLIKHLPPTGLQYQFHIIDYPEANAFNIPGGHVFVTRKLVADVRSEDELAGVIAHELGHAAVHHSTTDFSNSLRRILNVTSLGDRKDISEKYNLLLESSRTKKVQTRAGHEDEQQLEADRIGVFAMVAAGYDSAAYLSYFDRLTDSQGKTGSWFGDLFGKTTPTQKRMREMTKAVESLPKTCREIRAESQRESFLNWQAGVVSFSGLNRAEVLPGLVFKRELKPKLRSDVSRIIVSPTGRYIATRDDSSLTILERDPLKVSFQIPIEHVDQFGFTSDEKHLFFITNDLRFEKWTIADQKPAEVREVVLRKDCVENRLSPDGNYLACIDTSLAANLIHVPTGERVFQKKDFYQLNWLEYWRWIYSDDDDRRPFFRINFTPDSSTIVFSRSNHFRVDVNRVSIGSGYATYNKTLAVNTAGRRVVNVGGDFDDIAARSYAFVDANHVIGMITSNAQDAGIFTFPEGKRTKKFEMYANEIQPTGNPDYFIIRPLRNTTMGVFDARVAQIALGLNKEDVAVWKNQFIFESAAGKIVIREMTGTGAETSIDGPDRASVDLPAAAIGELRSSQISNNFRWLALSSSTRGGLWDMATGERKMLVTGFRGGLVGDDGASVAEFPKFEQEKHSLVLLNPMNQTTGVIRDLPDTGAKQFGRFVLVRSSLAEKPAKEKKPDEKSGPTSTVPVFQDGDINLLQNVRYELKDFIQDKVIWSRDFPKYSPRYAFDDFSGRLILYWYLGSEAGKGKLKESPELAAKAQALGDVNNDYLIEIVDAFAGKQVGTFFVETGKGSFRVGGGMSEGDWLVVFDSKDRVLVYSISTGTLRHRFFGGNAALNPTGNELAVENFPGEVTIYDLATGEPKASVTIRGRASLVRFNAEGTRLFILSDLQAAYFFDLKKVIQRPTP